MKQRIIYQSNDCLVINKLKGEAVEGVRAGMIDLPRLIATELGEVSKVSKACEIVEAVNRLDVVVTGCCLFALTKPALVFLNEAFAKSDVEKIYWAIIEKPKHPVQESGELVHWIETKSGMNKSFAHKIEKSGCKKAVLRYKVIGEGTNYLFMEIQLLTGRHHQIRAQLAAIGLHIKGDLKYGAKRSEKNGGIRLHARSLSFFDPINKKERISVTADPPEIDNLWQAFMDIICC